MATTYPLQTGWRSGARPRNANALPAGRLAAFSTIALPIYAAQTPIAVQLPAIYGSHFGLPLATLGLVFLAERIWGTLADPIVGTLSDRTRSRFGRRKSWIVGGAVVYAIATLFLFFPVAAVTPVTLSATLFLFYFAWSMIQIPYMAWSGEVSGDYHERTRVATYQTVAAAIALLLTLLLPTVVEQLRPNDALLKLHAMGAVILVSLVPTLFLTLRAFPEKPAPVVPHKRLPLLATFRLIATEGPLVRVLLSDFAVTTGQIIRGTLIVFYVTFYMGEPKWASGLFLVQFVFGIVAGPIWATIARRYGKDRTAVAGELVQVAINLGLLAVMPGNMPLLLALAIAQGFAQGSGNLMLRSMVADVADRHRLETGTDRTALFFSVFSISSKAAMAAGVGIALPLVAWLGFDPASNTNTPEALRWLAIVFATGPAVAHIISAALIHSFPIDEAAHAEIRRGLDARDGAAAAV